MAQRKTGFDSLGRQWEVKVVDGEPVLSPIGHDTDPDSYALAVEDELALLALVDCSIDENASDDHIGLLYDQARDRCEDARMGL